MRRTDPAELPRLPETPIEAPPPPDPLVGNHIPDSFLYDPSEDPDVWADIWQRDVRFRFSSHRGVAGRLIVWVKRRLARFWRAPLSDHFQRERIYNVVLLRMMQRHIEEIRRYLLEVRDPYSFLRDHAVPDLIARADALFGVLDRRIDRVEARVGELGDEVTRAATRPVAATASQAVEPTPASVDSGDSSYVSFEALHRGTEEEIRGRQSIYVELFGGRRNVIDLGCGRGEMLNLLRDAGVGAYGVDTNTAMVEQCQQAGLSVQHQDVVAHLESLADGSLDGAFSAQTFEHWNRERIVQVVRLLHRKLADGAPFVMETQNPMSLVVGASGFWRDMTHVRPIHPDAFEFLVQAVGFRGIEVRHLAPFPEKDRLPRIRLLDGLPETTLRVAEDFNRTVDALDSVLFGYRDYAVIAHK